MSSLQKVRVAPELNSYDNKRKRVALACDTCRSKKTRCGGRQPICQNCEALGVTCSWPQPPKNQAAQNRDYIAALERRVLALESSHYRSESPSDATLPCQRPETHGTRHRAISVHNYSPESGRQSSHPLSSRGWSSQDSGVRVLLEPDLEDESPSTSVSPKARAKACHFGPSSNMVFIRVLVNSMLPGRSANIQLENELETMAETVYECPPVLLQTSDMLAVIPSKGNSDRLLDIYFGYLHYLLPYLDESTIRRHSNSLYLRNGMKRVKRSTLALLNMIFALADQMCGQENSEDCYKLNTFFRRAEALMSSEILRAHSVESVQVLLLMCDYLKGTSEFQLCWNILGLATKIGQELGLHLTPYTGTYCPKEQEYRNRSWYAIVLWDSALAMLFGRSRLLHSDSYSTNLPEPFLTDALSPSNEDYSELTDVSYFKANIGLFLIVGDATDTILGRNIGNDVLQRIETPENLLQLAKLEEQLEHWRDSLPAWLGSCINRHEAPTILSEIQTKLAATIFFRYQIGIVLIHRAYFISELARTIPLEGYFTSLTGRTRVAVAVAHASVRTCVEASTEMIQFITRALEPRELYPRTYAAYYAFQAAVLILASGVLSYRANLACWGTTVEESIAHSQHCTLSALEILNSLSVDVSIASQNYLVLQKTLKLVELSWENQAYANNSRDVERINNCDPIQLLSSLAGSTEYSSSRDFEQLSIDTLLNEEWEKVLGQMPLI